MKHFKLFKKRVIAKDSRIILILRVCKKYACAYFAKYLFIYLIWLRPYTQLDYIVLR